MAIRVTENNQDFGRYGCGRRDYCDGSHALTEAQWQAKLAAEQASLGNNQNAENPQAQSSDQ